MNLTTLNLLAAISSAGLSKGHRGNPAALLRIHQLYAMPVLLSGLSSIVMIKSEIAMLETHFKNTIQNLQRLHKNTPRSVVYYLAGTTPFEATLHCRQLSLFRMICHLPTNPLYLHARYILSEATKTCGSWFLQIERICTQYGLPHPLELLDNPPQKEAFKKLVKLKILDYWQDTLRTEAAVLSSLSC